MPSPKYTEIDYKLITLWHTVNTGLAAMAAHTCLQNVQADLSLQWAHMPTCTFGWILAHSIFHLRKDNF